MQERTPAQLRAEHVGRSLAVIAAFERWADAPTQPYAAHALADAVDQLRAVAAALIAAEQRPLTNRTA